MLKITIWRQRLDSQIISRSINIFRHNSDFCVFDLETTGKNPIPSSNPNAPTAAKVLQLAARRYRYDHQARTYQLLTQLNFLLNDPTITEIDPFLTEKVHHISLEHLRSPELAASFGAELVDPLTAWQRFSNVLKGAVALGHNIDAFDIPFIQYDAARWQIEPPFLMADGRPLTRGYAKGTEIFSIDTLPISRLLWHFDNRGADKAGYKLRALADFLNVPTNPSLDHNALGDINTNWLVFLAMLPHLYSYRQRFMSAEGPDQYRGLLPPLRVKIPTPAEYAKMKEELLASREPGA